MKQLQKRITVSMLLTACLVPALSVKAQDNLNQKTVAFLDKQVQHFLKPWPNAKYQITMRENHKRAKECEAPDQLVRAASSRSPVGVVRVNMVCGDGSRSYRVADVSVHVPVVVSRDHLVRNQVLKPTDLQMADRPFEKLRGQFYTRMEKLAGRSLNRNVKRGKPIEAEHLAPAYLIKKGERVTMQAGREGLNVSMVGIALESGEHEHRIQVRNMASGKVVEAVVTAKGKVQVLF